jgi:hypothetical protein
MPMPVVRREPAEAAQPPATQQPEAPARQQAPDQEPAPEQSSQPVAQEPAPQQQDTQQPAPQPAPRPTPRPTPRPFPQVGARSAPEQAPAAQPEQSDVDADALFAPNVPAISEPTGRGIGSRPVTGFDLGETTPIFEEIASAWFRSNRQIPVNYEQQNGAARPEAGPSTPRPAPPAAAPQPAPRPPAPSPRPSPAPVPEPPPTAEVPIMPAPEPLQRRQPRQQKPQPPQPQPPQQPQPEHVPAEQEFASMADEGWRAASAVEEREDELTAAGLPKRRPRARLVPGSAGSSVLAPPAGSTRSAESIRGRLASYQQGVRQGRESRVRGDQQHISGTGPANAGGNHDEESS